MIIDTKESFKRVGRNKDGRVLERTPNYIIIPRFPDCGSHGPHKKSGIEDSTHRAGCDAVILRSKLEVSAAIASFLVSTAVTTYYIVHWPRHNFAECRYSYRALPSEDLGLHEFTDLNGCEYAIAKETADGNVKAALLGASYYGIVKDDKKMMIYYFKKAIELGDDESRLEASKWLVDVGDTKNCPEVLALIKGYKGLKHPVDEWGVKRNYAREKESLDDLLAICAPSPGKLESRSR